MMKKIGITGLALAGALAFSAPASAGDLFKREAVSLKDAPAPVWTWAGFYAGVSLGVAIQDGDFDFHFDDEKKDANWWKYHTKDWKFHHDDDDHTWLFDVHAGYAWQHGSKVFGIEGAVSFGDDIDYLGELRGILGFASDRWLIYATAGVAWLSTSDDFKIWDGGKWHKFNDDDHETGFVVGAGIKKKLHGNWTAGLEALYYIFDEDDDKHKLTTHNHPGTCTVKCDVDHNFKTDDELDFWVVRAKLQYHFHRHAPVESLK